MKRSDKLKDYLEYPPNDLVMTDCSNSAEKAENLRQDIVRRRLERDNQPLGCVTKS